MVIGSLHNINKVEITTFILHRGASVTVNLTSSHYRRSLFVQVGLEIPCKVAVKTDSSFNKTVLERYEDAIALSYELLDCNFLVIVKKYKLLKKEL